MCKEFDADWEALREELDTEKRSRSADDESVAEESAEVGPLLGAE